MQNFDVVYLPDLLGDTPLVRLDHFASTNRPTGVTLWAKLEAFNPGGSAKDCTARHRGRRPRRGIG
ncbi:hypothetical protein [Corynebacterium cystitidis]|uniref:hypothetical protein n=1 Tax=Corynebacterium cystitidis TaxID=35757 RepID=UPI00211DE351|nr:hypothetical protein [Corynebacterium cystitidis]